MRNKFSKELLSLVGLNGFFYFAWSWGCYQTLYLQENGMTTSDIGMLNAVTSVVAIFASTFWGVISDKINSIKKTMIANFLFLIVFTLFLPLLPTEAKYSTVMFIIYCSMLTFARSPSFTLMDNISIRNCTSSGLNYGAIRSFGSLTYTVGSILVAAVMSIISVKNTFVISALMMIPTLLFLLMCTDPKVVLTKKKAGPDKESIKKLFKSYYYVTFLVFALLFFIPRAGEFAFLTYFMEDYNIPLDNVGLIMAIRAGLEIPFLFFINAIRKKIHLKHLIIISAVCVAVECLGFGLLARDFASVLVFSAFFGLGNGIFIGVISVYLFRLAPEELKATAQSIYASVTSISSILGNLLGGFAYEMFGGSTFYIILGSTVVLSCIVLWLTTYIGKRKGLVNPADELG